MRETTSLDSAQHEPWELVLERPADSTPPGILDALQNRRLPAAVPGCVHTDLMAAGLLDDPYLDRNEDTQHWVGDSDWRYRTVFQAGTHDADRCDLVLDGVDTVATVALDDEILGEPRNMHRSYRFDVTSLLAPGGHELSVRLDAARPYAQQVCAAVGPRPNESPEPFQYLRKMACNFGWDWGPTLLTAGLWKGVRLERWSTARLASVRPQVTVELGTETDAHRGTIVLNVDVQRAGRDADLLLQLRVAGLSAQTSIPTGSCTGTLRLDVPRAQLWWPHDLGAQPLYDLDVTLLRADGVPLDAVTRRVGFRAVELRTGPDAEGTSFGLVVSGRDVFSRGANWIPDDCFPSRITRDRLRRRLSQAVEANINLVRVWGGGLYESDDFYEVCDELGLLVWQDFPFACAAYPEEEPLAAEVEAEARENVVRLMPHPSLVLWNGNNENFWKFHDCGWQDQLDGRTWGWGYYTTLLPRIVAELDPSRPYWPGSPYSGDPDRAPNDPAHGPVHIWTVWNELDYSAYRDYRPRFVAEFGFQGPPTWSTLTRAVHDDPLLPTSPGVLAHQKAADGNGKLARGMAPHLPDPVDTDDWHYLAQLNQARAVQLGLEHFRSLRPLCQGAVVWQLNDCWPATSWAAVDGDGRPKPLWYALRRSFTPQLITIQPRDGHLAVVLVNDARSAWHGTVELSRRTLSGEVLAQSSAPVRVGDGQTVQLSIADDLASPDRPASEVLVAELAGERALWFFVEDRDLDLDPNAASATVLQQRDAVDVVIAARSLVRGLMVQPDRVDPSATADDQDLTLLAGETRVLRIATSHRADRASWTTRPILRTVNDFRRR